MWSRKAALFAWLLIASLPLGCDTGPSEEDVDVSARLKGVAAFYGRCQAQQRGQPPRSEAEFESFLATLKPEEFATFNASGPDDLLVSPRDGKPFVVHYGVRTGPPQADGSSPVIAQEAANPEGPILGVTMLGEIQEIEESAGS